MEKNDKVRVNLTKKIGVIISQGSHSNKIVFRILYLISNSIHTECFYEDELSIIESDFMDVDQILSEFK